MDFEIVCPNHHNQTVTFSRHKFEAELKVECTLNSSVERRLGAIPEIDGSILTILPAGEYVLKLPDGRRLNVWFGVTGNIIVNQRWFRRERIQGGDSASLFEFGIVPPRMGQGFRQRRSQACQRVMYRCHRALE